MGQKSNTNKFQENWVQGKRKILYLVTAEIILRGGVLVTKIARMTAQKHMIFLVKNVNKKKCNLEALSFLLPTFCGGGFLS